MMGVIAMCECSQMSLRAVAALSMLMAFVMVGCGGDSATPIPELIDCTGPGCEADADDQGDASGNAGAPVRTFDGEPDPRDGEDDGQTGDGGAVDGDTPATPTDDGDDGTDAIEPDADATDPEPSPTPSVDDTDDVFNPDYPDYAVDSPDDMFLPDDYTPDPSDPDSFPWPWQDDSEITDLYDDLLDDPGYEPFDDPYEERSYQGTLAVGDPVDGDGGPDGATDVDAPSVAWRSLLSSSPSNGLDVQDILASAPAYVPDLLSLYIDGLTLGLIGSDTTGDRRDDSRLRNDVTYLEQTCRDSGISDSFCRRLYGR